MVHLVQEDRKVIQDTLSSLHEQFQALKVILAHQVGMVSADSKVKLDRGADVDHRDIKAQRFVLNL